MNRMLIVGLIVGVTTVGAAAGAYYYTDTHPNAPSAQSIAAQGAGAPPPEAPVAPLPGLSDAPPPESLTGPNVAPASLGGDGGPPANFQRPGGPVTLEAAISSFDPASQHLVWIMPPGVRARGPFTAEIIVKHDGQAQISRTLTMTAEFPEPGSRVEYARSAQAVRLTPGADWAPAMTELKAAIARLRAQHGPTGAEISVNSDFKTEIRAEDKPDFCGPGAELPPTKAYLDTGAPLMTQIDISGPAQLSFRTALLSGCRG
jgi:hypothetical protein